MRSKTAAADVENSEFINNPYQTNKDIGIRLSAFHFGGAHVRIPRSLSLVTLLCEVESFTVARARLLSKHENAHVDHQRVTHFEVISH